MIGLENVITGDREKTIPIWAKSKKLDLDFAKKLYKSIDEPIEFIFCMGKMEKILEKMTKSQKDEIRNALVRIQVWCSINSHHDAIKAEKQSYISQVMEKLFFSENILSEDDASEDDKTDEVEE